MECKITGCSDCPMFENNPDEGFICNHPDGDIVNRKGIDSYTGHPADCPLRKESLTITL